jgi:type I restriction enzyme S subunit
LAYLGENSIGGTYPTCRDETIFGYESEVPSTSEEQTAIATILSDMDAEIAALETKLSKARQVKQGMMQELLTGNIRLI